MLGFLHFSAQQNLYLISLDKCLRDFYVSACLAILGLQRWCKDTVFENELFKLAVSHFFQRCSVYNFYRSTP